MKKKIWDKQLNLSSQGLNGHIWKISDCNEVITFLCNENRVILGGEILKLKNGEYMFEGSSWYYNGNSSTESGEVAKKYFSSWSPTDDMAVIFVFKPD